MKTTGRSGMCLDWQLECSGKSYLRTVTPHVCVCVDMYTGLSASQSFTACVKARSPEKCFDPLPHMVKHSPPDSASFHAEAWGKKAERRRPSCGKRGVELVSHACPHLPQASVQESFFFLLPGFFFHVDLRGHLLSFLTSSLSLSVSLSTEFFSVVLWLNLSPSLSISTLLQQWEILQNP